jgi:hypothetical protein
VVTLQRRAGNEEINPVGQLDKLEHLVSFEINDKTPKGQIPVIEGWNKMRERLLLLGEMKQS